MPDDMLTLVVINLMFFLLLTCGLTVIAVGAGRELYLKKKPFAEEDDLDELDEWWKPNWGKLRARYERRYHEVETDLEAALSTARPISDQTRNRVETIRGESRKADARVGVLGRFATRLTDHRCRLEAAWESGAGPAFRAAVMNALAAYDAGLDKQIEAEWARLRSLGGDLARLRGAIEALGEPLGDPLTPLAQPEALSPAPQSTPESSERPDALSGDLRALVVERLQRRRERFADVQSVQDETAAHLNWARDVLLPALDRLLDREDTCEQIRAAMEEAGFREIRAEPGERSDGGRHEEIAQGATSERYGAGQILQRVSRGHEWTDTVLRRAQVVVAADAGSAGPA